MTTTFPDNELVAKCTPRGPDGDVIWTGHFSQGPNVQWTGRRSSVPMTYVMLHWSSRKNAHRTIDDIEVTNQYCGVGKGWDIVVYGTIIQHEDHKTTAQREAEKLLDGKMLCRKNKIRDWKRRHSTVYAAKASTVWKTSMNTGAPIPLRLLGGRITETST